VSLIAFAGATQLSSIVGVGFYCNRFIVEEAMARSDKHGNREAKKPKKAETEGNSSHFDARSD